MDPSKPKITKIARNAANFSQRQLNQYGLGTSEYDVLHCVRKHPGMSQQEICEELGMEKSALAHCVANLEDKGFIRREIDPSDKRRKCLYAEEKAELFKGERVILEADFYGWLMEDIPQEDLNVFLRVLDTIYQKSKAAKREKYQNIIISDDEDV